MTHGLSGVSAMNLMDNVSRTELPHTMYNMPTVMSLSVSVMSLSGLDGASAHSTQLEVMYRQGREFLNVVKRLQILLNVNHSSLPAVSTKY